MDVKARAQESDPSERRRTVSDPAVTVAADLGSPFGVVRKRPEYQGGAGMGQPPLMRGIDGGARREDPNVRAARWFRFIAATMRHGADDLDDTSYHGGLVTSAGELEALAAELSDEQPAMKLRLV